MRVVLSNVLAIYRKELQGYFASPLAYAIAGIFWFLAGILFWLVLLSPQGIIAQAALRDLQGQQLGAAPPPVDAAREYLDFYLGLMGFLSLFLLPILSMSLYTEERKRGTLELLATSPLTNWAVAVGKLLGVLTFFVTMLLPVVAYETIALSAAEPAMPLGAFLLAHAGWVLLAASVLSLGMFISSLTDSTILAAVFTFVLVFVLWFFDALAKGLGGPAGEALGHLSLLKHYGNLVQGVLDTSSLILFASYILLGIFLTAQSIEAFRFQRS